MRVSKVKMTQEEVDAQVKQHRPICVKSRNNKPDLYVKSLRFTNRLAYDAHLAEITINGQSTRINIEELKIALRYA